MLLHFDVLDIFGMINIYLLLDPIPHL